MNSESDKQSQSSTPTGFLDAVDSPGCVHCGLCLPACPTYTETGNENDSPRGRLYIMSALDDGRMKLSDDAVRHIDLCLGCRACESACPSGVRYGNQLEATREHIETHYKRDAQQKFLRTVVVEKILPVASRTRLAMAGASLARRTGASRLLPRSLQASLALLPESTEPGKLPETLSATTAKRRGRAGFLSGCVMSAMFGRTNASSAWLLNRCGYDVITPSAQGCCGALHAHGGTLEAARAMARDLIGIFENAEVDVVVVNTAGCGSMMKEYGHLLKDDPSWRERAEAFSAKVRDLVEVIEDSDFIEKLERKSPDDSTGTGLVTCHDACHLAHAQRIGHIPKNLLRKIAGDRYVELPESDLCCGSAGSYNLTQPEMAERLGRRKAESIISTGATTVVTTNAGCILQMRSALERAGRSDIHVVHVADWLLAVVVGD